MEAETASESCFFNEYYDQRTYTHIFVCVGVYETVQWHYFVADLWTDICCNEWNNHKGSRSGKCEKERCFPYREYRERAKFVGEKDSQCFYLECNCWAISNIHLQPPLFQFHPHHPFDRNKRGWVGEGCKITANPQQHMRGSWGFGIAQLTQWLG